MLSRTTPSSMRILRSLSPRCLRLQQPRLLSFGSHSLSKPIVRLLATRHQPSVAISSQSQFRAFSTSPTHKAQPQPADSIVDTLTELYGTARDEFEIAAEETEKKTVYASDDRDAAREAFAELKTAYEDAIKTSAPEVGKDVQGRVGQRIRELENALTALEESAMED